jgi:hypothetical protein
MTPTSAHCAPHHRSSEESSLRRGRETNRVEAYHIHDLFNGRHQFRFYQFYAFALQERQASFVLHAAFPFLNVRHHDPKATAVGSFILEEFFFSRRAMFSLFCFWVKALFAWSNFDGVVWGKWESMAAGLRPHHYYITSTGWD